MHLRKYNSELLVLHLTISFQSTEYFHSTAAAFQFEILHFWLQSQCPSLQLKGGSCSWKCTVSSVHWRCGIRQQRRMRRPRRGKGYKTLLPRVFFLHRRRSVSPAGGVSRNRSAVSLLLSARQNGSHQDSQETVPALPAASL